MYQYTICNQPDEEIFWKQCSALEKHIPGLRLIDDLQDVDGNLIRIYDKDGAKIKVMNHFDLGGIFIDSEIKLEQFFK